MYNIYTDVSFTHLAVAVVVHVHPIGDIKVETVIKLTHLELVTLFMVV